MKKLSLFIPVAACVGLVYAVGCQPNPGVTPATGTTPTPTTQATATPVPSNGNPLVPASHKYYAQADTNCLACHTDVKPATGNKVAFMPFPSNHSGRSASGCLGCHSKAPDAAPPVVDMTVAKVTSAPTIDGVGTDTVWNSATEVSLKVDGGVNSSETTIKLKAVHDGTNVYFRAILADPTQSLERQPLVKGADGKWTKTSAWPDKYEDKLSFIWNNPEKPIAGFDTQGCAVTCHAATKDWANKRPLMYTKNTGEFGDMWHAKTARHAAVPGIDQFDDQQVWHPADIEDATASANTIKDGGRKGDSQAAGTSSGDYTTNDINAETLLPAWMPAGADSVLKAGVNGNPYWMTATQSFDNSKFVAGDKLAAHLAKKLTGSRGNMDCVAKWSAGTWTYEWKRALDTTDTTGADVKFVPGQTYTMGAAYFDNNQIGHSAQFGVTKVKFAL